MDINVNEILNQLAKGFNVAVEELYPILYKQAIIDGIMSLAWISIFTILITGILLSLRHIIKKQKEAKEKYSEQYIEWKKSVSWENADILFPRKDKEWDWDEPRQLAFIALSVIIVIIALFAVPFNFENAITAFFNTEYYMIENILSKLK